MKRSRFTEEPIIGILQLKTYFLPWTVPAEESKPEGRIQSSGNLTDLGFGWYRRIPQEEHYLTTIETYDFIIACNCVKQQQ